MIAAIAVAGQDRRQARLHAWHRRRAREVSTPRSRSASIMKWPNTSSPTTPAIAVRQPQARSGARHDRAGAADRQLRGVDEHLGLPEGRFQARGGEHEVGVDVAEDEHVDGPGGLTARGSRCRWRRRRCRRRRDRRRGGSRCPPAGRSRGASRATAAAARPPSPLAASSTASGSVAAALASSAATEPWTTTSSPIGSTTATWKSRQGIPSTARRSDSGRMPTTTSRSGSARRREGEVPGGDAARPRARPRSRFIGGLPMKPATNTLLGAS